MERITRPRGTQTSSGKSIVNVCTKVRHRKVGESMATINQTGMGDAGRNKLKLFVRAGCDRPLDSKRQPACLIQQTQDTLKVTGRCFGSRAYPSWTVPYVCSPTCLPRVRHPLSLRTSRTRQAICAILTHILIFIMSLSIFHMIE
jgi:hypothetical protein